jgi:alkanesulfonate monooxygenase SsuD/methylene tetrahydromethanopterin reductase-like flavin-dependent oxidoreductase (luciferase family)
MVERAHHIESLGFDSLWVADHYVNPYAPNANWFDGWTALTGLATVTTRIRVGTLVSSITLHNPSMLARQAVTVDHLSNGRLELGLGLGGAPLDHGMTGISSWTPKERVERFREAVEIIDRLLRGETTTFNGHYYSIKEALVQPAPIQRPRPPLTLAAHGTSALKIVAKYADSWSSFGGKTREGRTPTSRENLELTRERSELLDKYCRELGRNPREIVRSYLDVWEGFFEGEQNPFSSPEAFESFVKGYREIDVNEFIFYYPNQPAQLRVLEEVAKGLIPKLRFA